MSLVIHVWPGRWDLPSFDPACLAAILYLQIALPGCFSIAEEVNPDLSPCGQLPYLTHLHRSISPLGSIIAYLAGLNAEIFAQRSDSESFELVPCLDVCLSPTQKHQTIAWRAYIEFHVGDFLKHSFYAFHPNYSSFTRPLLSSMMPWPQRLYVPDRLRDTLRPRMEALMMWTEGDRSSPVQSSTPSSVVPADLFRRTFDKARVLDKANNTFTLISHLLEEGEICDGVRPSTLDVILASHILPVLNAPLPDPFLRDLLLDSYPRIATHARGILDRASPGLLRVQHDTSYNMTPSEGMGFIGALTSICGAAARTVQTKQVLITKPETNMERRMRAGRWAWTSFAVVGLLGYALSQGIIVIGRVGNE